MFVLAGAGRLESLARGAGFEQVEVAEIPVRWRYEQYVGRVLVRPSPDAKSLLHRVRGKVLWRARSSSSTSRD